jgi:hypothetical protein
LTVIVSSLYLYFYNLYFFKFVYMYSSVKSIFISFEHDLYMAFVGLWLKIEMLVSRLMKFNLRNLLTEFILLIVSFCHFDTKIVSSNPVHGEVYSIQHYVIKFVSDLGQVSSFLRVLLFPPPVKHLWYNWNIVESAFKHHKLNQTVTLISRTIDKKMDCVHNWYSIIFFTSSQNLCFLS